MKPPTMDSSSKPSFKCENKFITLLSGGIIQCNGKLEFTGEPRNPQRNYLLYLKKSLNISSEVQVLSITTDVFKIENIVIKIIRLNIQKKHVI